jgi:hypothetical protein
MKRHTKKVMNQLAGSWFRAFGTAALACLMSGVTDWKVILNAGMVAVLPPIYRWLNPKDALGR